MRLAVVAMVEIPLLMALDWTAAPRAQDTARRHRRLPRPPAQPVALPIPESTLSRQRPLSALRAVVPRVPCKGDEGPRASLTNSRLRCEERRSGSPRTRGSTPFLIDCVPAHVAEPLTVRPRRILPLAPLTPLHTSTRPFLRNISGREIKTAAVNAEVLQFHPPPSQARSPQGRRARRPSPSHRLGCPPRHRPGAARGGSWPGRRGSAGTGNPDGDRKIRNRA
jgi:hypothetical protein